MFNSCVYHRNCNTYNKLCGTRVLVLSAFLALVLFGGTCANAQGVNENLSLRKGETNFVISSEGVITSERSERSNLIASLRGTNETRDKAIQKNTGSPRSRWSLAMTGTLTGAAAEIPNVLDMLNNPELHYTIWGEAYNEIDPNPVNTPIEWKEISATEAQNYTWQNELSQASVTIHHEDNNGNLVSSEGAIKIEISDSNVKYYSYNYTKPENYERLSNMTISPSTGDVENGYFYGNNETAVTVSGQPNSVIKNVDFIKCNQGIQMYQWRTLKGVKSNFIDNNKVFWINISYFNGNGNFQGNFINNHRGIIADHHQLNFVYGNFIGNNSISSSTYGSAIIDDQTMIREIVSKFIGNSAIGTDAEAAGGAVYFGRNSIGNLESIFISNLVNAKTNAKGGAIYTGSSARIGTTDSSGKAFGITNSDFYWNRALSENGTAKGGAIYNEGIIGRAEVGGGILNSNFIENYTKSESDTAQGGAIWTNKDLNIIADNGESTFKGNYVQVGNEEKDYQAIWLEGADKTLNLKQFNGGKMYMYDNINGTDGYSVNIQGDGTGTYYMFNDIKNANVSFDNTTINTVNNQIYTYNFNSLNIASNTNFVPDVDLINEKMDRITSNNITVADGAKLIISDMNLLNDAEKDSTKILFAEENLANHVDTSVKQVAYSPIYKYDVNYIVDENDSKGYFTFARNGGPKPSPTPGPSPSPSPSPTPKPSFNPAVIVTPVTTQAAAQAAMQNAFSYSFNHSDYTMNIPLAERIALRDRNKYALRELSDGANPLYMAQDTSTVWFKPYASFENIPLRNGPKVNAISYGTLVGYDTDLKELKRGWARSWTGYLGYNGASLHYSGVDSYQNGGLLGGTMSLYKGNFFNATTLSAGAMVGENNTMYGHETTTSLIAGIGNKTGYNFEYKQGKYILQPSLFLAYSFVNTFDYTNAAGVRIDSDPLHTIQISPGVKFIANTKNGWQPYASVNMVWNILDKTHVKANNVTLPEMSVKPYIQYGVGLQKRVKDNFTAYGQAMIQNGGRNGISLTAGFRWAIGKNCKLKHEKVQKINLKQQKTTQKNNSDRKILKSLSAKIL